MLYTLLLILGLSHLTFFGSSVCNGQGAEEVNHVKHGYAWQYAQLLDARHQADTTAGLYLYNNTSVNGINTVRHMELLPTHLSEGPGFAVIGLGLGNEGLHGAADPQAVYDQWKTNMQTIIRMAQEKGKAVIVTNNYPRGDYNPSDYSYVKRMNLEMQEWDVPTVNFLGALDNCAGDGQWAVGFQNGDDIYHPGQAGYDEMLHSFVPSLLDALAAGKPKPVRQTGEGRKLAEGQRLVFTPEDQVHSFTLAFRVRHIGAMQLDLTIDEGVAPALPDMPADERWHTLVLSHYYAAGKTYVYLDGVQQSVTDGSMLLQQAAVGGPCVVSDLHFWRAGMNADEIAAWHNNKMLCSSLELYCPLNNGSLINLAQSMNNSKFK